MLKKILKYGAVLSAVAILSGCATTGMMNEEGEPAQSVQQQIPASSKLSQIEPGMSVKQVTDILGDPTDKKYTQTWRIWIPFYDEYGSNITLYTYYYKGQGSILFGNAAGGNVDTYLVRTISYNPDETGYIE